MRTHGNKSALALRLFGSRINLALRHSLVSYVPTLSAHPFSRKGLWG